MPSYISPLPNYEESSEEKEVTLTDPESIITPWIYGDVICPYLSG